MSNITNTTYVQLEQLHGGLLLYNEWQFGLSANNVQFVSTYGKECQLYRMVLTDFVRYGFK